MYCDHRMAFLRHIKYHLVLFITTELTLVGCAGLQGWISMMNACIITNDEMGEDDENPYAAC